MFTFPTTVAVTGISQSYGLFHQTEKVTVHVASPSVDMPVPGKITITDGGQSKTVWVGPRGDASATFTFPLTSEVSRAHVVTATYPDASDHPHFLSSSAQTTAADTTVNQTFQFMVDSWLLMYVSGAFASGTNG
jgi:hypothetical protein